MKYVALLRGINVGGKMVAMSKLKAALEELGITDVKTLLNSGNVIFDTNTSKELLRSKIEKHLEKTFGFHIYVLIRTMSDIKKIIDSKPFEKVPVTPQTRLYVTFLSDKPTTKIEIPYETPEKDFKIISMSDTVVCSVITLSEKR